MGPMVQPCKSPFRLALELPDRRGRPLPGPGRLIPNRRNRKEPWPWDEVVREIDKQRNGIERAFAKAKQARRFATRYEDLRDVSLGLVRLRVMGVL